MRIECAQCSAALKVSDGLAGKRGKCPKCGAVIDIPASRQASGAESVPPATDKQKDYARSLGIEFAPGITKGDMSALISKGVDQRDDERLTKLDQLSNHESKAYKEIRAEILAEIDEEDCRLSKATPSQMVEEMETRDHGAILISFPIDEVDFENIAGAKFNVSFSDNLSETEMRAALVGLGSLVARQARG